MTEDTGKRDDGGAAFPVWPSSKSDGPWPVNVGMSMRDYFAAAALTGLSMAMVIESEAALQATGPKRQASDFAASMAYELADAMLRARARPSPPAAKAEG